MMHVVFDTFSIEELDESVPPQKLMFAYPISRSWKLVDWKVEYDPVTKKHFAMMLAMQTKNGWVMPTHWAYPLDFEMKEVK